jgi:sortase A
MTLEVAHAEYAGGGPGSALVRLHGRAHAPAPTRLAPPTLLIADGGRWQRLAPVVGTPLIDATPDGAPFAVAFDVPLHLAVGEGDWWLEPGPAVAASPARLDDLTARVAALRREVAALRDRVDREQALAALTAEIAALRERLEREATPAPEPAPTAAPTDAPAPEPQPDAPSPAAAPVPRAARLRALRPGLPALLVAAGALAVGDAVATVVWQEPVSALWASREQHALQDDLRDLDATYAKPSAAAAAGLTQNGASSATLVPDAPTRMRALAATLDRRTTAGRPLGELRIARLHARYVVVQGTRASSLSKGPGHYAGTPLPGQPGTVGIAGHRTTYGAPFRHLDALRRGDAITVTMPYGRFVYRVRGLRIVKPSDVSSLQVTTGQRLVLTACHPLYSAAKRLVAIAELQRATPRGAAANGTTA